ncbi:MAG: virulence RhuM family protein [Magnetococcales bacterium]|nr:virulence RhuM family protein [Magnetococcales bacterium]
MTDTNAPNGEILLYQTEDGRTRLQVLMTGETLWLSQALMAELFQTTPQNVTIHLKTIYQDGELDPVATCKEFLQVRQEGRRQVQRQVKHYNLDAILAVGYRVRSPAGVRFRQWASDKLKEYIVKGFTLDDERLKNPGKAPDYFDELTRRLQDIRTSERRFYQKITDIYATSVDYDSHHPLTREFFATVQNKVHYAIHGHTAAELIQQRADSAKPNMGLTTWEGAWPRRSDVAVAKNYLNEEELRALNNLAEQYLIFAEGQCERRIAMTMQDWITKLEGFLTLNDREILPDAGRVSAQLAKAHAETEFEKFRVLRDQRHESDFDRMVKQLPKSGKES